MLSVYDDAELLLAVLPTYDNVKLLLAVLRLRLAVLPVYNT